MKIAVTGKGGAGKSTISALMSRVCTTLGKKVILIDADPDMNLAGILGLGNDRQITPISELKELIAERTGTETGKPSPLFKMNPHVSDIPEKYWQDVSGIKLLAMGTVKRGGGGCACPENAFLKALLAHLFLARDEWVIVDMEAGIEHLGRGTAMAVDIMIIVVEPSRSSLETAGRIKKLSAETGIKNCKVIVNKIQRPEEREFVLEQCKKENLEVLGCLDFWPELNEINLGKKSIMGISGSVFKNLEKITEDLIGKYQ
jgi:CO dehydrogenase maturation factor